MVSYNFVDILFLDLCVVKPTTAGDVGRARFATEREAC